MATGWMIGVMVELQGELKPAQRFYAVGKPDQQRAEWAAVDSAMSEGRVATSPVGGMEPVRAIGPISIAVMKAMGLSQGEVRPLGWKPPRRWLGG